jgi:hypothetical protein
MAVLYAFGYKYHKMGLLSIVGLLPQQFESLAAALQSPFGER